MVVLLARPFLSVAFVLTTTRIIELHKAYHFKHNTYSKFRVRCVEMTPVTSFLCSFSYNHCVWLACHQAWPSPKYVHSESREFLSETSALLLCFLKNWLLSCVFWQATGRHLSLCAHFHLLSHFPCSLTEPYNLQAIWNIMLSGCRTQMRPLFFR